MDSQDLYKTWKEKQDKESFQNLYMTMKPDIENAAKRASIGSNIPQPVHKIWAAQSFYDSLRTYNPNAGASLKTHVWNSVQNKAKRLNYKYQDLGSKPEPRAAMVGLFQNETANLTMELGREPSALELSERMGVGIKDVERIRKEVKKDLAFDQGVGEDITFEQSVDEEILNFLYYELGNEEKLVYEHLFGRGGRSRALKPNGRVDFDEIAKRTGFSTSKVRQIAKKIGTKLQKHMRK